MCKLDIGAADDFYRFNDLVRLLLQPFLALLGDCEHWRRTEGITCMDTERINIFDKTDSNHAAFGVADDLKFKLLPSKDGFFYQYLTD